MAAFLGAVADVNDALAVETTLAEWTAREQRILGQMRAGLMHRERAASELYALARAHWKRANRAIDPPAETEHQYLQANRLLEKSIDVAPNSYAAAKSLMLIGNTFIGNRSDPQRSIEPFEKADQLLQDLIAKTDPTDQDAHDELWRSRGMVTERLGFSNLYTDRDEEAYKYFKTLVDSEEMSRNLLPGFLWNANRQLMLLAADREDVEESKKYYAVLEKMVESGYVDADRAILMRLTAIRNWWPDPFSKERIAALEELWNDPKYQSSRELLRVGDDLTWPYFFSEPMDRDEFAETSEKLLTKIRPRIEKSSDEKFSSLDSIYVRNLLLATEFARTEGDTDRLKKLTKEFMDTYEGRDIEILLKSDPVRPRFNRNLSRYDQLYRQNMNAHFEAAQQRARERLQDLQPTPAR